MKKIILLLIIILIPNLSLALEFKKIKKEAVVTNSKIKQIQKKSGTFKKDKTLQRFELRHGDTAGFDKSMMVKE
jgi:hypothetical protein